VLFLNLWIRILGPLVWSTISPETVTLDRASDSEVTDAPSTTRIGDSDTAVPASPSIFSTLTRSPSATLYCLPPVLTIAYMEGFPLLLGCVGTCGDHTGCAVFSACSPALTGPDRRFRRPLWSRPRFLARRPSAVTSDLSRLRRRGTAGQTGHAAGPSPLAVAPLGGDGRPCRAPARGPGPGRGDHRRRRLRQRRRLGRDVRDGCVRRGRRRRRRRRRRGGGRAGLPSGGAATRAPTPAGRPGSGGGCLRGRLLLRAGRLRRRLRLGVRGLDRRDGTVGLGRHRCLVGSRCVVVRPGGDVLGGRLRLCRPLTGGSAGRPATRA